MSKRRAMLAAASGAGADPASARSDPGDTRADKLPPYAESPPPAEPPPDAQELIAQQAQRIAELEAAQARSAVMLRYGIAAELAELHLTAADPELLERQAASLAELLRGVGTGPALSAVGTTPALSASPNGAGGAGPAPTADAAGGVPTRSLPTYAVPVSREELLEEQFRKLYGK